MCIIFVVLLFLYLLPLYTCICIQNPDKRESCVYRNYMHIWHIMQPAKMLQLPTIQLAYMVVEFYYLYILYLLPSKFFLKKKTEESNALYMRNDVNTYFIRYVHNTNIIYTQHHLVCYSSGILSAHQITHTLLDKSTSQYL